MTAQPEADELRIRSILKQRGVGPDATLPTVPPMPARPPRDWLDDILDDNTTPDPAPVDEEPASEPEPTAEQPEQKQPSKPRKPKTKGRKKNQPRSKRPGAPTAPRTAWDSRPDAPRQSLLEAWDRVPYRLRWLAYHATASAAGWRFGWVTWSTKTAAWYAAGHWTSAQAFVLYGLGTCAIALYRRSRGWARPVAWAAAIPVSSVVVGVLLYGTAP